jgi:hypothetical protein
MLDFTEFQPIFKKKFIDERAFSVGEFFLAIARFAKLISKFEVTVFIAVIALSWPQ